MPNYTAKPGAMRWPVPPGAGGDGTRAMSRTVHTAADRRPDADGHIPALRPVGAPVTEAGLARRAAEARSLAESLPARGVAAVAITIVDNTGIARVKTVPVTGLEHAARWGVGLSPVYGVASADESFTAVRAAEAETFGGLDPDAIAAAHRWIY